MLKKGAESLEETLKSIDALLDSQKEIIAEEIEKKTERSLIKVSFLFAVAEKSLVYPK